ncbi:MAG TPA: DUF2007 domain-containing protein [Methylomirabilota bacterium]|nr:DUF2007 domain-containing protein [Methylomirabilota bacterium]
MSFTVVFKTFSSAEAQIVRSRLDAAGFDATVINEIASLSMEGYSMAAGGIGVQVPASQAEDARRLIHSSPASSSDPSE